MSTIKRIKGEIVERICCVATVISPTLNTKIRYWLAFRRRLDLRFPRTFNEKLLWLKLKMYMNDPVVIQCADKYRVRDYIRECGCEDILIPIIGVWNNVEDIPWDDLPNQFVLKWNFGAGMNIICTDKAKIDKDKVFGQLREWGKCRYWLPYSEMQYKYTPKVIICEQLLRERE